MTQWIAHWRQAYQALLSKSIPRSRQYALLAIILLAVLVVRLAAISSPPLERTAWKEIDYLEISQNYWRNGFNFLRPEVTWPAEPPRVTEMELPLVPFAAAVLYELFGFNVVTARAITLCAFLLLVVYVFKLAKRELGASAGLVAALAAGVLPLYHPFNRYLFSEPTMIALSVTSLYYVAEWVDHQRRKDWILALVTFSLAIALKLESLYLFLPVAWIAFRTYRWEAKRYKGLSILVILALILPALWYGYAYYLENTGAHVFGIFKGHNKFQTLSMLSDYRWYREMAFRVTGGILGGIVGTLLFAIGLVAAVGTRKAGLFFAYLAAVGVYFALVAEGNIDAPYRQMPMIPPAAVFVALGAQAMVAAGMATYQSLRRATAAAPYRGIALTACLALVIMVPLRNYRNVVPKASSDGGGRWRIAQQIREHAADESKLVVIGEYTKHVGGYDLSPVLYYYAGIQGWTLTPADWRLERIEALRERGAALLVVVPRYDGNPSAMNYQAEESPASLIAQLEERYPVLHESQDGLIMDLRTSTGEEAP